MSPLFGRSAPTPEPTPAAPEPEPAQPEDYNPGALPPEYVTPGSRFYVPPELRPHYSRDVVGGLGKLTPGTMDSRYLARHINRARLAADPDAWQAVLERRAAAVVHHNESEHESNRRRRAVISELEERGPWKYQPSVEEGDAWEARLTDDDRYYGCHLRDLERAQGAHDRALKRAGNLERRRAYQTCHICGQVTDTTAECTIDRAQVRTVRTSGQVRACEACARALADHLLASAAAELVNGRTRANLAAEWIGVQP